MSTVFETLVKIDVSKWIEKKGNLSYLSWSHAYRATKEKYPLMTYTVYENELGFNYHTDGTTCWVKVGTTIEELEHIEYLPVMNYKNKSIPKEQVTSMDVNTAIQRALTKSLARHGLGINVYAGEDINPYAEPEPKIYNTWTKSEEQEKLLNKKEFMDMCVENGVEATDIADFLDFVSPGMDEKAKYNEIIHFLRKKDLLEDQLESYKLFKIKQAS